MNYDVAVPITWFVFALIGALATALWAAYAFPKQYRDRPEYAQRWIKIVWASCVGFLLVFYLLHTDGVRVRGENLEIRGEFSFSYHKYAVRDIAYYTVQRVRARGLGSNQRVVLYFADGEAYNLNPGYSDASRFLGLLQSRRVPKEILDPGNP